MSMISDRVGAFLETQKDVLCVTAELEHAPGGPYPAGYRFARDVWTPLDGSDGLLDDGYVMVSAVVRTYNARKYKDEETELGEFLRSRKYDPDRDYGVPDPLETGPNAGKFDVAVERDRMYARAVANQVGCDVDDALEFVEWAKKFPLQGYDDRSRFTFHIEDGKTAYFYISDDFSGKHTCDVGYMFRKWLKSRRRRRR